MSFITLDEAKEMVANYTTLRPDLLKEEYSTDVLPLSIVFEKSEIDTLLGQDGAAKARIYFGMNGDNNITTIIVAANENGEDIINEHDPLLLDTGKRCPIDCPNTSALTS